MAHPAAALLVEPSLTSVLTQLVRSIASGLNWGLIKDGKKNILERRCIRCLGLLLTNYHKPSDLKQQKIILSHSSGG